MNCPTAKQQHVRLTELLHDDFKFCKAEVAGATWKHGSIYQHDVEPTWTRGHETTMTSDHWTIGPHLRHPRHLLNNKNEFNHLVNANVTNLQ